MVSPALAVEPATPPTSAVLVKSKVAKLTLMVVTPVPESPAPSLVVVLLARSVIGPEFYALSLHDALPILMLAPAATSWAAQSRVWAVLSTTQPVAVVLAGSGVHTTPLDARLAVMCTPWARPAPVLWAVMV